MLDTAQLHVLRAAILAETDPAFTALRDSKSDGEMAAWFNQPSTTIVWRTAVTQDEIMQNGFDWVQVDNLSVGKARIWDWLFKNQALTMNPSKGNVRGGIDECWKGTAAMLSVRAAIYLHCKRPATRGEKLFATGTGTDASPATMGMEGDVTYYDVYVAMNDLG